MNLRSVFAAAVVAAACVRLPAQVPFALGPARFWAGGVASAPRVPLVGDMDGDGRDDLVSVDRTEKGLVDLVRTSVLGKPMFPVRAREGFGGGAVCVVVGRHAGSVRDGVLALLADGTVTVAHRVAEGVPGFDEVVVVGQVDPGKVPAGPIRGVSVDVNRDGVDDVVLVGGKGEVLLLTIAAGAAGRRVQALAVAGMIRAAELTAGDLDGDGRAELVWIDSRGKLWRSGIAVGADHAALAAPVAMGAVGRGARVTAGRFTGSRGADVLAGRWLYPAGGGSRQALRDAPGEDAARRDLAWFAADLDGDDKDELLRVRRSGEPNVGDDVLVHVPSRAAALLDGDNDGLPDAWETGTVRPGGLDLAALGCNPARADILVEVQRLPDMPEDRTRSEMARVARYFAGLPMRNPDGSTGAALQVIIREPVPEADRAKPWWDMGAATHPNGHRGVTHWMAVYNGGGGQSSEMSDRGSCGGGALYATFIHEFGHQLGLGHTGFWNAAWCPIYPSLMNYAYSYQLGGKGDAIAYSDGRLAGLTLDERRLSERITLPPDRIAFLGGPPYHFRTKPSADGRATLIDWNWNGVLGERRVAADINYGYSTTAGLRHTIGKSYTAAAPVVVGSGKMARLVVVVGALPGGAAVPASAATEPQPGLSPQRPGRLCARAWLGKDRAVDGPKWTDEVELEPGGVTGDASTAAVKGRAWVAYPSVDGVRVRQLTVSPSGTVAAGRQVTAPGTAGAQPTLAAVGDGLVLLLWRGPGAPVSMRPVRFDGPAVVFGPEVDLGFTSTAPVGAAEGAPEGGQRTLWVGLSQNQDAQRPVRWQVRHFALERTAPRLLSTEWIGGERGQERGPTRIALLWERDRALGRAGQLHFFGGGLQSPEAPWSCHYVATRVADKTVNGGWLTRRFYDEWTQSRSAPGVCWLNGDLFFAARWFGNVHGTENDNLFVAFYGRGIEAEPMGDFDDITFVRDVGISHSIPYVTE